MPKAPDILAKAQQEMLDRAAVRDTPDGERSMAATVNAFNAIYGTSMTETQGWQFMVILKMVRANQGKYHADDYVDQTAYSSLAAESAEPQMHIHSMHVTMEEALQKYVWCK